MYTKTRRDSGNCKLRTMQRIAGYKPDVVVLTDNQHLNGTRKLRTMGVACPIVVVEHDEGRYKKQQNRAALLGVKHVHGDLFNFLSTCEYRRAAVWADLETSRVSEDQLLVLSKIKGIGTITITARDRKYSLEHRLEVVRKHLPRASQLRGYKRKKGALMIEVDYGEKPCRDFKYEIAWVRKEGNRLEVHWLGFPKNDYYDCTRFTDHGDNTASFVIEGQLIHTTLKK